MDILPEGPAPANAKLVPFPLGAARPRSRPPLEAGDVVAEARARMVEDVVEALDTADRVAKLVDDFVRWDEMLQCLPDAGSGEMAIEAALGALYEILEWLGTNATRGAWATDCASPHDGIAGLRGAVVRILEQAP